MVKVKVVIDWAGLERFVNTLGCKLVAAVGNTSVIFPAKGNTTGKSAYKVRFIKQVFVCLLSNARDALCEASPSIRSNPTMVVVQLQFIT